jgi:hypothetical protein
VQTGGHLADVERMVHRLALAIDVVISGNCLAELGLVQKRVNGSNTMKTDRRHQPISRASMQNSDIPFTDEVE